MKKTSTLFILLFFCTLLLNAQSEGTNYDLYLKTGVVELPENGQAFIHNPEMYELEITNGRFYRIFQFYDIPNTIIQKRLEKLDIRLLEYLPRNAYVVSIPRNFNIKKLEPYNLRSVIPINSALKIDARLKDANLPSWAMSRNDISVLVKYQKDIPSTQISDFFQAIDAQITNRYDYSNILTLQVNPNLINIIAELPFVNYIEPIAPPSEPEDDEGRSLHRSNTMASDYSAGRHYDGTGVSVAVGDDGEYGPHIDFTGRINNDDVLGDLAGGHGDMVAGILGGAGNLNPKYKGMAFGAYVYMMDVWNAVEQSPTLHANDGVVITSTSYSNGCNAGYTTFAQTADMQVYQNPSLIHVFSAGNSNNNDCGYGAGSQWGNITGGVKIGKNVIATANLNNSDNLQNSSSRGPASDGRIKPDISANGANQISTDPNNGYSPGGGTSAAAPGISGCLAQLYQAYRELNGGVNPESGLLKACILNGADDLGNVGPDFKFGWGRVNGRRAVEVLEQNQYIMDSIDQGGANTHTLNIPSGVKEARVMVYWIDPEGSTLAQFALVNNINMTIDRPDGTTDLPLILDHTPNATTLDMPAQPGIDSINNVEQIRYTNPVAGSYSINIDGAAIPQGLQSYYIVYYYVTDDIIVTYPQGGEGIIPNQPEIIRWDAYGISGNFNIDYFDGNTWNSIGSVNGNVRQYTWIPPNVVNGQAKIRVSRGIESGESSADFTIMQTPSNLQINEACPSYLRLTWNAVSGATGYDVFLLGQKYMDSIGTTTLTTYDIPITDPTIDNWVSVRARGVNNAVSRRAIAINHSSGLLNCVLSNDMSMIQLLQPTLSAQVVSCGQYQGDVQVQVQNTGQNDQPNYIVYYQLNNDPVQSETINTSIAAGATSTITFLTQLNISTSGNYIFKTWVEAPSDEATFNDTISVDFELVIVNSAGTAIPYVEDFESGVFPPVNWIIGNPDGGTTWTEQNVIGASGAQTVCARVNNYNYNAPGEEDYLISIPLDLTNVSGSVSLTFDVAYSYYSNTLFDGLRVSVADCDLTINDEVYFKEHTALATAGLQQNTWTPSSGGDWRNESISLDNYIGDVVSIRFTNINGYGNNLFIDNINIQSNTNAPVASFQMSGTSPHCINDNISFTSTSIGSNLTHDWDFGVGAIPATATGIGPHQVSYSTSNTKTVQLQVSNAVGSSTKQENIDIQAEVVPSFSFYNNSLTYTFTSTSTNADTYIWDFGDGSNSVQQNPTHTYTNYGNYTVILAVNNSCGTKTHSESILIVGIEDLESIIRAQIVPNPNEGVFSLIVEQQDISDLGVSIMDIQGKLVAQYKYSNFSKNFNEKIDISTYPKGVYFLKLQSEQSVKSLKLVIQ